MANIELQQANESAADDKRKIQLPKAKDGVLMLPSAFKDLRGRPRFHLPIPPQLLADVAIKHLVEREAGFGGFEYPTRAFLDAHLEPGDLFIDVGAHWGIMSLTAATRARGEIKVLAIEAHPLNVVCLVDAVVRNQLDSHVEVVSAGAGDQSGTAPLVANSTMGHSLHGVGLKGLRPQGYAVSVPLVTLDQLLAERPALAERPVVIKIDVEGFEPQVIEGAAELLDSGRVKAIIWEKGRAFDEQPGFSAMIDMVTHLEKLGFKHRMLPSHDLGGPLLPFVPGAGSCNVFSLAAGVEPKRAYIRPPGPIPPMAPSNRGTKDPEERRVLTEALILVRGSDAWRWGDPSELSEGAEARAALAAPHIAPGQRLLDLGAGAMRLRALLPEGCHYTPVDLVPFSPDCLVMDLNRGELPEVEVDLVLALEFLEFVHDVPQLLQRIAEKAGRLICSYRCHDAISTRDRRRQGWVNDHSEQDFADMLAAAGWAIEERERGAGTTLFVCRRS